MIARLAEKLRQAWFPADTIDAEDQEIYQFGLFICCIRFHFSPLLSW